MPDIRMPGGEVVRFPETMSRAEINVAIAKKYPPPMAPKGDRLGHEPVGVVEDIARSIPSGLRSGIEGLVGQVGTIGEWQGAGAEWLANKLGASPETAGTIGGVARRATAMPFAPSTAEIQAGTDAAIGERYQPETALGRYAERVAEFAPNAISPGTAVRKAAMTTIPAVASVAAGDMAKGTELEPYAEPAAAILTAAATAGRAPGVVKQAAKGAPTTAALADETNQLYGALRDAGISYDPNAFSYMVTKAADDLVKEGFRPAIATQAFTYLDEIAKGAGKAPDFDDVNAIVSRLGGAARDARRAGQDQQAAALEIIRDRVMKFEEIAPLTSTVPMSREGINAIRGQARETALRRIKGRLLDDIKANAEFYRGGEEAGIRNQISTLLRSKRGKQLFKGEELKALAEVANGRKPLQTLSRFGFDLNSKGGNAVAVPALGAIGANAAIGPEAAAATAGISTVMKMLSGLRSSRAFEQTSAAIRSGKLRDPKVLAANKAEELQATVRRLIGAETAVRAGGDR